MEEKSMRIGRKKGDPNKVRDCWGVREAFRAVRKNHWFNIGRPLSDMEFHTIIRKVNDLLAEEIANGQTVRLPARMGSLMLRKYHVGVSMKDNKLKITYPPNWSETAKLWYEDEEARKKKLLLRHENPYIYRMYYDKWSAVYENKVFYQFALNTFIKRKLSKNIINQKVDTLW